MAIAGSNSPPTTPTNKGSKIKLKKIDEPQSIKIVFYEQFVGDLVKLLNKMGLPYHRFPIRIPQDKTMIFWEEPRELFPQNQSDAGYLFYADLVNIIGQVAEWYFDNGNERGQKILKPILPFVRDEKILPTLFGSDNTTDDSVIAANFQIKILPIINRLFIAANANSETGIEGVDKSEYLLEQEKKAEEEANKKERDVAAALELAAKEAESKRRSGGTVAGDGAESQGKSGDTDQSTEDRIQQVVTTTNEDGQQPIRALRISDLKAIETEVAWISSPLVYSLFASHGIPQSFIDQHPDLRRDLYEHVRQTYLKSQSKSRTEVYSWARTSLPYEFLGRLNILYEEYSSTLPLDQQRAFVESVQKSLGLLKSYSPMPADTGKLFEQDVAKLLGSDNPAVSQNIKNAIEALIVAHGAPVQILAQDGSGAIRTTNIAGQENNALHVIERLPNNYLQLIFGINPNIKLTPAQIEKLRAIAIGYCQQRVVEMVLIARQESVANGIASINIQGFDNLAPMAETYMVRRSLNKALPGFFNIRSDVTEHGAEVVTKAFNTNTRDQDIRRLRLWNDLDRKRKEYILQYLGVKNDGNLDLTVPPAQISFFNTAELILKSNEAVEAEIEQTRVNAQLIEAAQKALEDRFLKAFAEAQYDMVVEEQLRRQYLGIFLQSLNDIERQEFEAYYAQMIGSMQLPDVYESSINYSAISPAEAIGLFDDAHQAEVEVPGLQQPDARISGRQTRSGGVRSQIGRIRGKKAGVAKKGAKKMAEKLTQDQLKEKATQQLISKASLAAGPWGKVAALLADKKKRKWLLAGGGVLGGLVITGIIKMFTAGKSALIGGLAGGAAGAGIGFLIGGPVGAVIGALIGAGVGGWGGASLGGGLNMSLGGGVETPLNSLGGSSSSAATTGATRQVFNSSSTAATTQAVSTGSAGVATAGAQFLTSIPIGMLAPFGAMAGIAMASFYVLWVIMAAFLVPIQVGYDFENTPNLPPGLNACWPTSGRLSQLAQPGHGGIWYVGGITQAIDIACAFGTTCPGGEISPPEVYASHNGVVRILLADPFAYNGGYGLHIVIDSPDGFSTLYGHLSEIAPGLETGDSVGRGQFIAYMGNTGNSSGPHLHYEYSGGLISSIVPPGEYQLGFNAVENCSTGGVPNENIEGYLAIGPLTTENVVASTANDISSLATPSTCGWQGTKGLTVGVNANLYNLDFSPIGFAGEGGSVQYYEDPGDASLIPQLTTLRDSAGSFSIVTGNVQNIDAWDMAVTGINTDSTTERSRTALGIGTATAECSTEYSGRNSLFLAVMPNATSDEIETKLRECGASQVVHLGGGNSSAFCSSTLTYSASSTTNPVNIGMREAEVTEFLTQAPE
jgi:hypothetical protein